jgi:hypothetical protein
MAYSAAPKERYTVLILERYKNSNFCAGGSDVRMSLDDYLS